MAKSQRTEQVQPTRKPLVWLHGEIKTPPFTLEGRQEAGMLLRLLQEGEQVGMPQAEPLSEVGPRCGALRVRDADHNWRIMYRIDSDAVLILEVYAKKTRKIPDEVLERCQRRLKQFDAGCQGSEAKPINGRGRGLWMRQNEKHFKRRVGRSVMLLIFWR